MQRFVEQYRRKIILTLLLLFQMQIFFAQSWSREKQGAYRIRLDFENGLHYLSLIKTAPNISDTAQTFYHLGSTASVTLIQPLVYLNRKLSICAFIKPGFASPWSKVISKHHHHFQNSWELWQFPFGAAIKIIDKNNSARNNYKWEGLMIGTGLTFNYYNLKQHNIPDLIPTKPQIYFFATWHADQFGFRIAATQKQNHFYRNGINTISNWEFTTSILFTTRW